MIVLDLSILNQKGTPMFNSDLTANRPAAGIVGRIFIATDAPYGIFRDTGTGWDQVSSAGGGATIYTGDGTLTGTRTISSGGFQLVFNPQTTFFSSLIASTSASSFSVLGSNTLNYNAGFSSSNIGNVYSANGAINAQIFSGNATFAQANLASAMVNVNKIDFSSGGHTINMTQSTGIRAMTGVQNQIQFTGSHNGTISHAAVSQNLGFFRDTGSTRTLTITNAYSHLINALDDYGAGFSFTNRWGIYQAGASDTNYFAANSLFGTTVNAGFRVDIAGTARVSNSLHLGVDNFIRTPFADFFTDGSTPLRIVKIYNLFNLDNGGTLTLGGNLNCQRLFSALNQDGGGTGIYTGSITAVVSGFSRNMTNQPRQVLQLTSTGGGSVINGPKLSFLDISRGNATGFASYVGIDVIDCEVRLNSTSGSTIVGGSSINASAKLQIDSNTQGFLPPRMTNAQRTAIGSPSVGLIVYCTDSVEGLYIYKSTGWTFII